MINDALYDRIFAIDFMESESFFFFNNLDLLQEYKICLTFESESINQYNYSNQIRGKRMLESVSFFMFLSIIINLII